MCWCWFFLLGRLPSHWHRHFISCSFHRPCCGRVCECVRVDHLYRCKPLLSARGMAVVSLAMPTKLWDSAGRECARTLLYLHIFYIVPPLGAFKSQLRGHIVYRSRFTSSTPPVILNIYIYVYVYTHIYMYVYIHIYIIYLSTDSFSLCQFVLLVSFARPTRSTLQFDMTFSHVWGNGNG